MEKFSQNRIVRAFQRVKTDGWPGIERQIKFLLWKRAQKRNYQEWIRKHDTPDEAVKAEMVRQVDLLKNQPLISIVMPVYNVDEKWLRLCLDSVLDQLYQNWELCIADDASTAPHIRPVLEEYVRKDPRIKVVFRPENGHISAASNSALMLAGGEWTVLLDHDDELTPDALFYLVKEINEHPDAQMIYSDEDLIDEYGRRFEPKFKPDWSRDLFYSLNLITHLSAFRTEVLKKVGGFRIGFEGSQDYDLTLRVIEQISETQIRHISKILYHWRAISGSVALGPNEKPYAHDRARLAIREHLERTKTNAAVTTGYGSLHRVNYELPEMVKISVVFDGDEKAAAEILANGGHKNVELISLENENSRSFAGRLNNAAKKATGDIIVFLESGVIGASESWLKEIAGFAWQKKIGAVGLKVLYKNGTIHLGGLILGINGGVGFAYRGEPNWRLDSLMRAQVINNFSAVSGVCMATRREVFDQLGGFDESAFPNGSYDVDYCLRLGEKNYRIIWTPHAEMVKDEKTATEKMIENQDQAEAKNFRERWSLALEKDPYYNPNLTRKGEDLSIAVD